MKTAIRTTLAAGTFALAAAAVALPANAAPLGKLDSLKNSASPAATNVQWRHHHRGRNVAIGLGALGAGLVVGSAIANQNAYYGDPYYGYQQPYGYTYGYAAPAYGYGYEPSYPYQQPYNNWTANRSGNQVDGWDNLADYAR